MSERLLIMIPTYNEVENVGLMQSGIMALGLDCDLLFVDDNSPDGTGAVIDEAVAGNPRIHVIHRPGKLGLGSAHLDGIRWAYGQGYSRLITMDSDLTHSPSDISRMLAEGDKAEVVVGSRFTRKESLQGWTPVRKLMTHTGHFLTSTLLGLPADATGAFRLYNLDRIPLDIFEMVESKGYSFFYESLHRLFINGFAVHEIPIDLPARTYGHSKMRFKDVAESVRFLVRLAGLTHFCRSRLIYAPPQAVAAAAEGEDVRRNWDAYWSKKAKPGLALYDLVASFYRRFIIRQALDHTLAQEFPAGAHLLHAGCGSGAVDVGAAARYTLDALDISPRALEEYLRQHDGKGNVLLGSIMQIPAADGSYDGVFNLGVMEHFEEDDIHAILVEFHRVLAPGGRIVLFWPPAYGLATNALKLIHFVLNRVLGRTVKLHPDEITHVTDRARTEGWLRRAGFRLKSSQFGPRDAFTHEIVIGEKIDDAAQADAEPAAAPEPEGWEQVKRHLGGMLNRGRIVSSYLKGQSQVSSLPVELILEITSFCNLACPMCPRPHMTRPNSYMDIGLFRKIIDEIKGHIELVYLAGGLGEPLAHPRFGEFIAYCRANNVKVGLSTNATLLNDKKSEVLLANPPDILLLSLDGATKEIHERMRVGSDFETTMGNVDRFLAGKAARGATLPYTICQMVYTPVNAADAAAFQQRWSGVAGVNDVRMKKFLHLEGADMVPDAGETDSAAQTLSCILPWRQLAIACDGTLALCCRDLDFKNVIGNVRDSSIRQLWNSPVMQKYRETLANGRKSEIAICKDCPTVKTTPVTLVGSVLVDTYNVRLLLPWLEKLAAKTGLKMLEYD